MTLAQKVSGQWVALTPGDPVKYNDVVASWGTVTNWNESDRNAFGVYTVRENPNPPAGKVAVPGDIVDKSGLPVRFYSYVDAPVVEDTSKFIPTSMLRQRAVKLGIWDDLAAYLVQYPSLLLTALTVESGIDPKYPALLQGFNDLEIPQSVQDYLLADPTLGVY